MYEKGTDSTDGIWEMGRVRKENITSGCDTLCQFKCTVFVAFTTEFSVGINVLYIYYFPSLKYRGGSPDQEELI